VPEFRPLFNNAGTELPMATRAVLAVGDGLRDFGWALGLAVVAGLLLLRQSWLMPTGRLWWDRRILHMPLIGDIVRKAEVARFSHILGTLLAGGVAVLPAVSTAVDTLSNRELTSGTAGVTGRLKRGEGLAAALNESGLMPTKALQLIHVGDETNQLEAMLLRIAELYDEDVRRSLQRRLALLVPATTVVLGVIVAAIIGSMLMAIMSAYKLAV